MQQKTELKKIVKGPLLLRNSEISEENTLEKINTGRLQSFMQ